MRKIVDGHFKQFFFLCFLYKTVVPFVLEIKRVEVGFKVISLLIYLAKIFDWQDAL
jgi:hypothetical protein